MSVINNINTDSLVIDFGSATTKADIATKVIPTVVFESIIGRPKYNKIIPSKTEYQIVSPKPEIRSLYQIYKPIQRGVLRSEEDAKAILSKIYGELSVINQTEVPVFLTEPPANSISQKKMLADLLFSQFGVPYIFFGTQSVLSLYAFGKTDGIILESGDGVTQISTVRDGYKIENGSERINFGGSDVTDYLRTLFKKAGVFVNSSSEDAIFNEIKKSVCQLNTNVTQKIYSLQKALVQDSKGGKIEEINYQLPDGKNISIGSERFLAPELLFNPSLAGFEHPSLAELLEGVLSRIDIDLSKNISNLVYLSGGNTQLVGFVERFAKEVGSLVGDKLARTLIVPNTNRTFLAWQGGAILSNMSSFSSLWISKKEIDEVGDRIFALKNF